MVVILTNYFLLIQVRDDLQVCTAEYGGEPGFLHLLGAGTLLYDWASGRDSLSHVTSNSGSRLWDF
jgi:hypothetical protein